MNIGACMLSGCMVPAFLGSRGVTGIPEDGRNWDEQTLESTTRLPGRKEECSEKWSVKEVDLVHPGFLVGLCRCLGCTKKKLDCYCRLHSVRRYQTVARQADSYLYQRLVTGRIGGADGPSGRPSRRPFWCGAAGRSQQPRAYVTRQAPSSDSERGPWGRRRTAARC